MFDRRREWAVWRGNEPEGDTYRFATCYEIELAPLPCWRHLEPEAYRDEVARLISEIEAEAAADRESTQKDFLGVSGVFDQNPLDSPKKPKKSPRPFIHAARRRARIEFRMAYQEFEAGYAEAAERLREGKWNVEFPADCFPPTLPITGEDPASPLPPPVKREPLLTSEGRGDSAGQGGLCPHQDEDLLVVVRHGVSLQRRGFCLERCSNQGKGSAAMRSVFPSHH